MMHTISSVSQVVRSFLRERGVAVTENNPLTLGSLDYVALLLYVEQALDVVIDDAVFFAEGLPEYLGSICERLILALSAREE